MNSPIINSIFQVFVQQPLVCLFSLFFRPSIPCPSRSIARLSSTLSPVRNHFSMPLRARALPTPARLPRPSPPRVSYVRFLIDEIWIVGNSLLSPFSSLPTEVSIPEGKLYLDFDQQGKGLKAADLNGKSDPYCLLYEGTEVFADPKKVHLLSPPPTLF